jgi:hypothetical protein
LALTVLLLRIVEGSDAEKSGDVGHLLDISDTLAQKLLLILGRLLLSRFFA